MTVGDKIFLKLEEKKVKIPLEDQKSRISQRVFELLEQWMVPWSVGQSCPGFKNFLCNSERRCLTDWKNKKRYFTWPGDGSIFAPAIFCQST